LLGFVDYSASRDDDTRRDGDAGPAPVGEVNALYLLPAAWGRGVGRLLMEAALARLTQAGFAQATLWVLDTNARARRFYAAGGWSADGAVKRDDSRGFPITQLRYRKSLIPA
jgi:GNAT superfamily N-acetyltransferase